MTGVQTCALPIYAAKEGIWLRRLIGELFSPIDNLTPLYCNNQAALTLATTDNFHAQTKHIDICYHFIRHEVSLGTLKLIYCPTDDMVANILTKPLPGWKVKVHTAALGLCSACGGVQKCTVILLTMPEWVGNPVDCASLHCEVHT